MRRLEKVGDYDYNGCQVNLIRLYLSLLDISAPLTPESRLTTPDIAVPSQHCGDDGDETPRFYSYDEYAQSRIAYSLCVRDMGFCC